MRVIVIAVAGLIAAAPAAPGQDAPGRFALQPSADGFIRLDTRTGAASHCGRREGVWRCEPFAEESAAIEARLARLEAEIAALKAAVAALAARLDAATPPAPEGAAPTAAGPRAADTPGFSERLMQRFFALVREMKGARANSE
jgi:hypothetical protein